MLKVQRATLLFLIKNDQILLAMKKRGFGKGYWNGVGGKVNSLETSKQAAIRETKEEINIIPKNIEKVASLDFHIAKTKSEETWIQRVSVYKTSNWDGEPTETEEMKPKWFRISDIPYSKMWADDILWLPKILQGQKIKGEFWFDENFKVKKYLLTSETK